MIMSPAGLMFRRLATVALAALTLCGLLVTIDPARAQMGFDRPGGDYGSAQISTRDPADCAMACERDRRCKAWSFNFPSDPLANGSCWLKNTLPPRVSDTCCVSGVRGAGVVEQRSGLVEMFIDRFGGDYRNFEVESGEADQACREACTKDTRCRAWTYARAGYAGRDARCFLKGEIKPPRRAPGLVSGVVR